MQAGLHDTILTAGWEGGGGGGGGGGQHWFSSQAILAIQCNRL